MAVCFEHGIFTSKTCFCFQLLIKHLLKEMMFIEKPIFFKLFGCVVFMHNEKPFRKNLITPQKKGIFLGNSENSKCYFIGFEAEKRELKI